MNPEQQPPTPYIESDPSTSVPPVEAQPAPPSAAPDAYPQFAPPQTQSSPYPSQRVVVLVNTTGVMIAAVGGAAAVLAFFAFPYIELPIVGSLTGLQTTNTLHNLYQTAQALSQTLGQTSSSSFDISLVLWLQVSLAALVAGVAGWQWTRARQIGASPTRGMLISALIGAILGIIVMLYPYISFQSQASSSTSGQLATALVNFGFGFWLMVLGFAAAIGGTILQLRADSAQLPHVISGPRIYQPLTPPYMQTASQTPRVSAAFSPAPSALPQRRTTSGTTITIALLALALTVSVAALLFSRGWSGFGVTPSATTSDGGGLPTATVTGFRVDQLYTYNANIGHSKTTELTNDNVTVTLLSLGLSSASSASQLIVSFHDYDTQKGAHFLFQTLSNVYLLDDQGYRYQALSATPDEVLIDPGQGGTVAVTLPLVKSSARSLQLYFNTDKTALVTPCISLLPTGNTTTCQ